MTGAGDGLATPPGGEPGPAAARLFVALPVPAEAAGRLSGLPRRGLPDARWTRADDLHITLRFLGDLERPDFPALAAALGRIRRASFSVEIRGLGLFDQGRQAVLYAKIESVRKVTSLCADVTDALVPLGFDFGMRPFVPHITLAHAAGGRKAAAWRDLNDRAAAASWRADRFMLMQSGGMDGDGRRYRIVEEFPLAG